MNGEPLSAYVAIDDPETIEVGDLRIVVDEYVATLDGERLDLTNKEFALLVLFARNRGRLLTRDQIAAQAWGGHAPGRTIDIHVARLRSRLPREAISTVIKVGYRFELS